MNLLEVRTLFARHSGRYDLVNADNSDNGADFFINAGQDWLDRKFRFPKDEGRVIKVLSDGKSFVQIQRARAITEIFAYTSTARTLLTRADRRELEVYYSTPYDLLERGTPLYWAPAVMRGVDRVPANGVTGFESDIVTIDGNNDIVGLLILPPPSEEIRLDIRGLFYSTKLEMDGDESYWSQVSPNILLMAALRQVEVFHRNTEGVKDWTNAVLDELMDLDKDVVDQDIVDINQMEG